MANKYPRVLCIDPAQSICGWAILDLKLGKNTQDPVVVVNRFGCIKSAAVAQRVANKELVDRYSKTVITLSLLEDSISTLIEEFNPDYVVIEDAFFNPKRPAAFASLLQCISVVAMMCYAKYKLSTYRIPTRSAKKCILQGSANKKDIIKAVLESPNIVFKQKKNAENLVEHEADAIIVGYYFVLNILPGILSLMNNTTEGK